MCPGPSSPWFCPSPVSWELGELGPCCAQEGTGGPGRGSWSWVSSPWHFSSPVCQTRRSPEFFFSASLKQPKCNIPLKHSSDADSSVTFYSKGFYFVFFRICKVEINRNYTISSTDNIQIDSLNKSLSWFLFFVVFPWLSSWKQMITWSLNIFKNWKLRSQSCSNIIPAAQGGRGWVLRYLGKLHNKY